jgi:WD40 repeat protein
MTARITVGADPIDALAFAPDDRVLAIGLPKGSVELRDTRTATRRAILTGEGMGYVSLAFNPDGTRLAGTDERGNVAIWDTTSPARDAAFLPAHADRAVFSPPAWSADGRVIATVDTAGVVTLWDAGTRSPVGDPISTGVPVANTAIAFSPKGATLAVGTVGGGVMLYDAHLHRAEAPLPLLGRLVTWLAFSSDGATLATCDTAGAVTLWDTTTHVARGPALRVGVTTANRGGVLTSKQLVTIGPETAAVWRTESRDPALGKVLRDFKRASGALLTPDGATLQMGDEDGAYAYYDVRRQAIGNYGSVGRTFSQSFAATFSPDGLGVANAHTDGRVVVYDVADSGSTTFLGHRLPAVVVAFSPDGHRLAAGGVDGTVLVWDVATRRRLQTLGGGGAAMWGVAFSPDGRLLAVSSIDGAVTLYDAQTYRVIHTFATHEAPFHVAFSPDSRTLAIAGSAGTLLLDVASARPLGAPLTGHTALVFDVAFTRDGHTLATASDDGTVVLYDVASEQPIGDPLAAEDGRATGVALTPDGRTLFTSHDGGEVVRWDIDPDSWQRLACTIAGRNLTRDEWRQYLGNRPYHATCER